MSYKMPVGVDTFSDLLDKKNNYLYVDKSLWVKEIIEDNHQAILITCPKGWGKTLNLSMLQHFFALQVSGRSTRGMFDALQIAQVQNQNYMAHQGRYPVIFLSLKDIEGLNFADALEQITLQIRKCYQEHAYLLESAHLFNIGKKAYERFLSSKNHFTQAEVESSLQLLTQFLFLHYRQPVYLLIDEYDSPFIHASMQGYLEKLTNFFKVFFNNALSKNHYLKKVIMTGVLQITKENMLSDLNNLNVHTLLGKQHHQYFGFTEEEMNGLCQAAGLGHDTVKVAQLNNSCNVGEMVLYNPWSTVNYISYNIDLMSIANDNLLKIALPNFTMSSDIKIKFEQLLLENSHAMLIHDQVSSEEVARGDESAIWSLLLFNGYLKAVAVLPEHTYYKCMLYNEVLSNWLVEHTNKPCYNRLLSNLIAGDVETFTRNIYDFLLESSSSYDYTKQPEAFYQGFILALNAGLSLTHIVELTPKSSSGHSDILYIPKDPKQSVAIILDFQQADGSLQQTVAGLAQVTLSQIKSNTYEAKLQQYPHVQNILKIGLGFLNKAICTAYRIESIGQNARATTNVKLTAVYGDIECDREALVEISQHMQSNKRLVSEWEEEVDDQLMIDGSMTDSTDSSIAVPHTVIKKPRLASTPESTVVSAPYQSSNLNQHRFFSTQQSISSNASDEAEVPSEDESDFSANNDTYYQKHENCRERYIFLQ